MASPKYKKAGIDQVAANQLVAQLSTHPSPANLVLGIGDFAAAVALPTDMTEPLLVTSCDGVGTKLILLAATGRYAVAGQDLVAMCVNDLACAGAQPWLMLDYYACDQLEPAAAMAVLQGVRAACADAACTLVGGETAQLPGILADQQFDLVGTAIGLVERTALLSPAAVAVGDAIIGLRTSGIGCNGFTLVREILAGGAALDTPLADQTVADWLLAPTPRYTTAVLSLRAAGIALRSAAHITGGGLLGNLPRALPAGYGVALPAAQLSLPPLHAWLQRAGELSTEEMLEVFNHGIGMALVVAADAVDQACACLGQAGWDAAPIGTVTATPGVELV